METYRYEMNILGQKFALQTTEEREYLDSIVEFISDRIDEINAQGVTSSTRCVILASFYIADELMKLRNNRSTPVDEYAYKKIRKRIDSLLKKVDKVLKEDNTLF